MLTQAEIEKMTVPQRMEAIDRLWASIVESGEDIPSPDWHREILEERMQEIKSGKAEWMTLEELRAALRLPEK
jgi:putative addiction module component (TIGR02574 family)